MTTATPSFSAKDLAALLGQHEPTEEQIAVIEAPPDQPLLVVAGAGSGKTETMAARVVWLVANEIVRPHHILGMTFTRKAAHELSSRISKRLRTLTSCLQETGHALPEGLVRGDDDLVGQRPLIHTYNGFALELVRDHALSIGHDPEATVMSASAAWQLAYHVVENWHEPLQIAASPATITAAVMSMASSLADHGLDLADVEQELIEIREHLLGIPLQASGSRKSMPSKLKEAVTTIEDRLAILPMVQAYADARRAAGGIDFSDQVALATRIASSVPAAAQRARSQHRVVLLDEFQDTSVAQLMMLTGLFGPGHPALAVGDPNQAIYGWRGASAASLAGFARAFSTDDCPVQQLSLSTSWRNDAAILNAANCSSKPLRDPGAHECATQKGATPEGATPGNPGEPTGSQPAQLPAEEPAVAIPILQARKGHGPGSVEAFVASDDRSEAEQIAAWIQHARDQHAPPEESADSAEALSAAVLVRTRKQIAAIADALTAAGFTVDIVGLGGLLHQPEVADVRALLTCVHDPLRGDAAIRLLSGPRFRIAGRDLAALGAWRSELAWRRLRARNRAAQNDGEDQLDTHDLEADNRTVVNSADRAAASDAVIDDAEDITVLDSIAQLPPPGWRDRSGRELSAVARKRLQDFQSVIDSVRAQRSVPLPDLVTVAIRALGVDLTLWERINTAQPFAEYGPSASASARATHALRDLETLRDHAEDFARSAADPDVGAWLALLDISEDEENALSRQEEASVVEDPRVVTISTIHAAKGLEWDLVVIAGLNEGTFPSHSVKRSTTPDGKPSPIQAKGWLGQLKNAEVPASLRGDADSLPQVEWAQADTQVDADSLLQDYYQAMGQYGIDEDRRLMYVAITRAKKRLLLTSCAWREGLKNPREPSRFLTELRPQLPPDAVTTCDIPEDNPCAEAESTAQWPPPPGDREATRARAATLLAAAAQQPPVTATTIVARAQHELRERTQPLQAPMPVRTSASQALRFAADPHQAALDLLRPAPRRPSAAAHRGTAFHAWVEARFNSAALLDMDDIDSLVDETERDATTDLEQLREAFLATPWATRQPLVVEHPVVTHAAGMTVRGIIDAVFADPEGTDGSAGVLIVDWKTGHRPEKKRLRAMSVQLSLYRKAWHEATGLDPHAIRTAFHFIPDGETVYVTEHPSDRELEERIHALN